MNLADFDRDSKVVFSQVQGEKGSSEYISTRQKRLSETDWLDWGMFVALERAEGVEGNAGTHKVGYLIASPGQTPGPWVNPLSFTVDDGMGLEIGLTGQIIKSYPVNIPLSKEFFRSSPHVFANIASYYEQDSAHLRRMVLNPDIAEELYVMIEEDKNNDREMLHTGERVSYMAIEVKGDGLLRLQHLGPPKNPLDVPQN